MNDKEKIASLTDLLNECLESMNQEYSFKVKGIIDGKFVVAFDIVENEADEYIGFAEY